MLCVPAVAFLDEQMCIKDGGIHIQVGRYAGHIFYGQRDHPTSTVLGPASPFPTRDYTTLPLSSPGLEQDSGGSKEVIGGAGVSCQWTVVALPGQRIRLRVIVIDPWDPLTGVESHDTVGGSDTCPETLLIQDSVLVSTVHLPVCRGRQRDSQIYLSIGHQLSIRVEQSGVHAVRHGRTREPQWHSSTSTSIVHSRRSGFLLTYECQYHNYCHSVRL